MYTCKSKRVSIDPVITTYQDETCRPCRSWPLQPDRPSSPHTAGYTDNLFRTSQALSGNTLLAVVHFLCHRSVARTVHCPPASVLSLGTEQNVKKSFNESKEAITCNSYGLPSWLPILLNQKSFLQGHPT